MSPINDFIAFSCSPASQARANPEVPVPCCVDPPFFHAVDDEELVECFQSLSPPRSGSGSGSSTTHDREAILRACAASRTGFQASESAPPHGAQLSASLSSHSGVAPHRVFSKDEISVLMEQRRQREKNQYDEQRVAARRSMNSASATRSANVVGLSALPPAQPALFASSTTHPMAYSVGYAGASATAPGAGTVAASPPPPYAHVIPQDPAAAATRVCATQPQPPPQPQLQQTQQPQQQQQQQLFGLWGYQQHLQYVNPSVIATQSAVQPLAMPYDPAALLRTQQQMEHVQQQQQQQQQQQVHSHQQHHYHHQRHDSGVPQIGAPGGSIRGMSMQELSVLARLITMAQEEQKQQPAFGEAVQMQNLLALLNHQGVAQKVNTPFYSTAQDIIGVARPGNQGRADNLYNAS